MIGTWAQVEDVKWRATRQGTAFTGMLEELILADRKGKEDQTRS